MTQSAPTKTPGHKTTPSPITARGPTTTLAWMETFLPILASSATTALSWIPTGYWGLGASASSTWAQASLGLATRIVGRSSSGASSGTMTQAAALVTGRLKVPFFSSKGDISRPRLIDRRCSGDHKVGRAIQFSAYEACDLVEPQHPPYFPSLGIQPTVRLS